MIVQALKDLITGSGEKEEIFNVSHAENILSIEVTGGGSFELQVLGQMESSDSFSSTAAIQMSKFTAAETIKEEGLYMVDVVALSKVKIKLIGASEEIIVSCRTFDDSK